MLSLRRLVLVAALISAVSAKSFLQQLLSWDFDLSKATEQRDAEQPQPISNCVCDGPGCICCSDFNLTYIDLGGPGCVRLKYISPEEGMAVNISYGSSELHSEVVKGPNPEPTCMNLLTDLAQICARFTELKPTSDGVRGCLNLEPRILGDSQAEYELGCFRVGPQGMHFDPPPNNTRPATVESATTSEPGAEEEQPSEGPTDEEVLSAVSETAEQGLAFLSNLFGIDLQSEGGESTTAGNETSSEQSATTAAPANQGRAMVDTRANEVV
ncbi:hypothetical protein B566_EDAN011402 [Ephemera danica]|nr:hypothetical protein B566_EDAN011402 [Ephemera danica]